MPDRSCAYLRIAGDECAFVETHTAHAVPKLLGALEANGLRPEQVRWIIVTHAHLDHAGGAGAILARCPNATFVAHPRAARHLIDPERLVASATQVYGAARFAEFYGKVQSIPRERARTLEDGETFELGGATLRAHHVLGHARHHFVIEDPALDCVYTGDAFGMVLPALQKARRFAIASTSPTDFDPVEARRSLERIAALGARWACLTHFDAIEDMAEVGAQVRGWIDRSEELLEEAARSDTPDDALEARVAEGLRAALVTEADRVGLTLGEREWAELALDLELNSQGIAFAATRRRTRTAVP
jgi:glyoxylase-like metal-dependent hydrolase (beta-lactamase superfamily II)